MSNRTMKRSMLKAQYAKFCEAWAAEKTYQRIYVADGKELPKNVELLGRKPTFKMWLTAMENRRLAEQSRPAEKAVEVKDTSWEE